MRRDPRRSPVPIGAGEHEYTRWGYKELLDARAADLSGRHLLGGRHLRDGQDLRPLLGIRHPDLPHGHSVGQRPPDRGALAGPELPHLEFLVKWNQFHQYFYNPLLPVNGIVTVPTGPGMGIELDPAKIVSEREFAVD